MTDPIDDRMTRLSTAARGVRMALDVLGQEIREMERLSDAMKAAINDLQNGVEDDIDIPNGIKPVPQPEKLQAIGDG